MSFAEEYFDKALQHDPNHSNTLYLYARMLTETNMYRFCRKPSDLQRGLSMYSRAADVSTSDEMTGEIISEHVKVLQECTDTPEITIVAMYERSINLIPLDTIVLFNYGSYCLQRR